LPSGLQQNSPTFAPEGSQKTRGNCNGKWEEGEGWEESEEREEWEEREREKDSKDQKDQKGQRDGKDRRDSGALSYHSLRVTLPRSSFTLLPVPAVAQDAPLNPGESRSPPYDDGTASSWSAQAMLAPWFPSAMLMGWNGKQQKRGFPPQKAGAWLQHSKTASSQYQGRTSGFSRPGFRDCHNLSCGWGHFLAKDMAVFRGWRESEEDQCWILSGLALKL
jgi:hypothetical protein